MSQVSVHDHKLTIMLKHIRALNDKIPFPMSPKYLLLFN